MAIHTTIELPTDRACAVGKQTSRDGSLNETTEPE
jgi:hypothetical protein